MFGPFIMFAYALVGIAFFSIMISLLDARDEDGVSTLTRLQEWLVIFAAAGWPIVAIIVLVIVTVGATYKLASNK